MAKQKDKPGSASSGVVLLNPGSAPVVYNDDSQSVEPGKKVTVEWIDTTGKRAIDAGLLKIDDSATTQEGDGEQEAPVAEETGTATAKKTPAPK